MKQKTIVIATLLIVAVAALTAGVSYTLANQPAEDQTDQTITYGEPSPGGMPGLETRPENQTGGPDGPQL